MNLRRWPVVGPVMGVAVGVVLSVVSITFGPAPSAKADCPDVQLIFARGTAEPPGLGVVGDALFGALQPALGSRNVDSYAVNYPASYNFLTTADGANDARDHIAQMVDQCPSTRLVLGGFSILALEGRLVQIAFLQGPMVKELNWTPVMVKRLTLTGSTLRPRTLAQKAQVAQALREKVWPLLDSGAVKPLVHATFPMERTRAAHELMESSAHLGKIIVTTGK